ncbi:MAG: hypothetical protein AAF357_13855 [Verrucomicrobiota bacterium]
MPIPKTLRRIQFLGTCLVLIPEAVFFAVIAVWRGSRFIGSLRDEGPPAWHSLSSAIFLTTAALFCLRICRDVRRKLSPPDESTELAKGKMDRPPLDRVTSVWLVFALFNCMAVIPGLILILGFVLDRGEQAQWLVGIPVGLGIILYFTIMRRRSRVRKRV